MTDAELVRRFEDASLSGREFTHALHVRVAWIYLERYGRDEALERMTGGLRRLVARLGQPDKFDRDLTRAWIDVIHAARTSHPGARSFEELAAACPHLLDKPAARAAAAAVRTDPPGADS